VLAIRHISAVKPKHEGLLNELLAQALASRLTSIDQYFGEAAVPARAFPRCLAASE
jgi:hypothetical protein